LAPALLQKNIEETVMPKDGRRVRIFSALEVANICGVVNQTAINWIRNGHLKAFTTPGGQYRIYAKDLAAFLDKRGMSASGEVLQVMMENASWNNLLIAAEKIINNSIKADLEKLFPRYTIFQAFNWFEVGRKITEEKPGFLLLDSELSGVNISEFMDTAKEDPFFGKPYIFLMIDSQKTYESSVEKADLVLSRPPDMKKLEATIKSIEKTLDTTLSDREREITA
jgi:excisionase family DNA binding protein